MPGRNARPGPSAHHVSHRAIWSIAAAIIVLALAGCTTTATTPNTSATDVATASPATGGHTLTLTGAGSTFDAPFFNLAFARYHQEHPGISHVTGSRQNARQPTRHVGTLGT